ncbi:MAG: hypothetical protein N2483_05480 [Burkholderiaceae bacterium]|nr:hypothetical protein [Burkholderiaceae bacterium]
MARRFGRMLIAALGCALGAQSVTSAEAGRLIYERGLQPDGQPVSARAGADLGWVLRGSAVACANCHGLDAAGGREGALHAPDLRWPAWSSPEPAQRAAARERLFAAVTRGRAADGRPLATAMPRFDLSEAAFAALALHIEELATMPPKAARPRFALLHAALEARTEFDRDFERYLQECLRTRIGARAEFVLGHAADQHEVQALWHAWSLQSEIVAAIAPWWRPGPPGRLLLAESTPLPALFPRIADPIPTVADSAHWLFGNWQARAAALIIAWLQQSTAESSLSVWFDRGAQRAAQQQGLQRIAEAVRQTTGRGIAWQTAGASFLPAGRVGLWLDAARVPTGGIWLMPLATAAPANAAVRAWLAIPYTGRAMRPLAQRWAEAACLTVDTALADAPSIDRARWNELLLRLPRLRDADGWEWHLARDAREYGAATAWTVVEFQQGASPRIVVPLVDVGRPRQHATASP